jgi:acyl-CoA hydrolase/RimJ/RimL family protein N-acetyltransferase
MMASVQEHWRKRYADRICTAAEAVREVRKGQRVLIGSGCAEPQLLSEALAERGDELADTQIVHLLTLGTAPYAQPKFQKGFRHNALFIGANVRDAIAEGRADFTPVFLSEVPALMRSGQIPIHVALVSVSPPDEHGYCSYGVAVDVVKAAVECAQLVVAEVNENMPRALGDSFVHISKLHRLVPSREPVLELHVGEPDDVATRIGRNIVDLIEDGSTLQLGIGTIPDAVLSALKGKKNLGIHTEMFSDGVIDLVESGVINGEKKTLHPGKIIASFVLGTRRLFDFIDNNPMCEFHPTEYTNDPFIVAQNEKMVSINSALQVDLTGQVCADSLGTYFYSGIGGQVDFVRGAARSKGGKPIIALPSTAKNGTISRIAATLLPGAGVVTSRGDVHYVVTEWGVAYLHGKTIRERAMALIHIAHPKFREQLMAEARERNMVYQDQFVSDSLGLPDQDDMDSVYTTPDGVELQVRPIKPVDEDHVRDLFYSYSPETVLHRFFHAISALPHKELQRYIEVDYRQDMILVAMRQEGGAEQMIAVGRYHVDPATGAAEVAFSMRDDWQHKGIGTYLCRQLIDIARRRGYNRFVAEVMTDNHAMIRLFHKCALGPVHTETVSGSYRLSFTAPPSAPSEGVAATAERAES